MRLKKSIDHFIFTTRPNFAIIAMLDRVFNLFKVVCSGFV